MYGDINDFDAPPQGGPVYGDPTYVAPTGFRPSTVKKNKSSDGFSTETIAREKFDRFEEFYKPIEDEYIAGLFNPEAREEEVDTQVGLVRGQFDNANKAAGQTYARYGQPTGDMADFNKRKQEIEQMLGETATANRTRGLVYDRDMTGAQSMSAMARGLSGQASSSLSAAEGMAADRHNAYDNAKANHKQSIYGAVGTGLGIAAMMMI